MSDVSEKNNDHNSGCIALIGIAILQTATHCIFYTVATSATTKPQRHEDQFSLWLRAFV